MKRDKLLFLLILFIAFGVRLWGIWFDLPYIYTTEEYKVVNYALKMRATKDPNPHFFNYPSLYLYFTLFVSGIYFIIGRIFGVFTSAQDFAYSFIRNPTGIYLILRIFSAVWSTGVVGMTYIIGKQSYNRRVGFLGMLMITFIPSILVSAHEIRPSMPMMFFVLLSFYFLIKYYRNGQIKHFYWSAIILGIAISIFYSALPLIVLLPIVYFSHEREMRLLDKKLWFAFFFVLLFFILGTPFSIFDFKTFINDFSAHTRGAISNLPKGAVAIPINLLFVGTRTLGLPLINLPLLGIICLLGIFVVLQERRTESIFLTTPVVAFSIPVAMYHCPDLGYLFPAISFFLLAGARFIDKIIAEAHHRFGGISENIRGIRRIYLYVLGVFFACLIPSIIECVRIDYSYSLKDTRTIAKEWIEENIPFGSKVLIDMYAKSPPIKMTKGQLEKLYKRAVELDHYKKEYLRLQYEVHPGGNYGYEIYQIQRPPEEVSGAIEMVKEAQKTQDLLDVGKGFNYLRKEGIQYIISNSFDEESILRSDDPSLINFYQNLNKEGQLVKEFSPKTRLHPGPVIRVYNLQ